MNATEHSLAAFRATRCFIPAKLGSLSLFQAAEMADAIGNVRVCCQHAFWYGTGKEMPEHFAQRLQQGIPSGNVLTLATAKRVLTLWHKSTYGSRAHFPSLSDVQNFLFDLSRLSRL
jgi:hypothetical protein